MNRQYLILSILLLLFIQPVLAEQIEVDHMPYVGKRSCIVSNNTTYCADRDFGGIFLYRGSAYCGAGQCLSKGGNVYCSPFTGGDIIRNNGALWTGPGQCVKFNGNVRCAKEPMGICIEKNGNVRCQGGWVKELPVKANRCETLELFR